MATTFTAILLGNTTTRIDPTEGNSTAENASGLVGQTYGSGGAPLFSRVTSITTMDNGGAAGSLDQDNETSNDQFTTNNGAGTVIQTFDALVEYNATITYADGSTATITALVAQDTAGNLYLLPERQMNADTTALEAKPIASMTLNSVSISSAVGMAADRYVTGFDDGVIAGTAGNDVIDGSYVEPVANGTDKVDNSDGTAAGNADGDSIVAGAGDDSVYSNLGQDTVYGGMGNDVVFGGDGNDQLFGEDGNDQLFGGAGIDSLYGGLGNDTLTGGDSADVIDGGSGIDIADYTGSSAGVSINLLTGALSGGDAAGDTLTGIEGITGSTLADTLTAGSAATTIAGGAGNDLVTGGTGTGLFDLGDGDDTYAAVVGDLGADTVFGGAGNDLVQLGTSNTSDIVYGGAGNDTITNDIGLSSGNDTIYGGDGRDVITAGVNDFIDGGSGGDDFDTLTVASSSVGVNVTLTSSGAGSGSAAGFSASFTEIEAYTLSSFADTFSGGNDTVGMQVNAGSGNDAVLSGAGNDVLFGEAGNDTLSGGAGNDSLYGGTEADTLAGDAGNDLLDGGAGSDTADYSASTSGVTVALSTGVGSGGSAAGDTLSGIENVIGSGFADSLTGDNGANLLYGGAGHDTFSSGSGDDLLDGGDGNDVFMPGPGADTIFGGLGNDLIYLSDNDIIDGGAGTDTLDAVFGTFGETVVFTNATGGSASGGSFQNIEVFQSDAGADNYDANAATGNLTISTGADNDTVVGGSGNDSISGGSGSDQLSGGAGNDTLAGGSGDDTVSTGTGNDLAEGGDGSDTFLVTSGQGNDTLSGGESAGDVDALRLEAAAGGVTVVYTGAEAGTYSFANGGGGTFSQIEVVSATAGNDLLDARSATGGINADGAAGNDSLLGSSHNDTLAGGSGDDTLAGGGGNDVITGGSGTDVAVFTGPVTDYSFDYGAGGSLVVTDSVGGRDGVDTLSGVEYVTFNGITYQLVTGDDGSNTVLQGPPGTPALIIAHDGNDWGGGHMSSDVIFGGAGDDTLDGGDGNDTLLGEGDHDLLRGDAGADSLLGGSGHDTLQGGTGNDTLEGGADNDVLQGDTGDDSLSGGAGNDTLQGGAGNDALTGGTGRDLFELGAGADVIHDFDRGDADNDGLTDDQLDVSELVNGAGDPVKAFDVVIGTDSIGNAVLLFPGGEQVTIVGLSPAAAAAPGALYAMGIPCFAAGTRILTPQGERAVEEIAVGDIVLTVEGPAVPVLWTACRHLSHHDLHSRPDLRPIRLRAGRFGNRRDLTLSPQHGVKVGDALIRARHLAEFAPGARVAKGIRTVSYHHILLPRHACLWAEGCPTESFYPGAVAVAALLAPDRAALAKVILSQNGAGALPDIYGPRCAPLLTRPQAAALLRHGIAEATHPKLTVPDFCP